MQAAIMIPTYNEKENLADLVHAIYQQPFRPGDQVHLCVVDDDSPDGTGKLADELAEQYPGRIHVIHRSERGRGTAGLAGFRCCLELGVDVILEMDADFSHDPVYLPLFLDLSNHFDVVIGSRGVEGGAIVSRGGIRDFLTFCANTLYRLILGLKIRDISGGYKCYRRKVMEALPLERFLSEGYSVGMETLYRCKKSGFSFVEFPIRFEDRKRGGSKFRFSEALRALWVTVRLRLRRIQTEIRNADMG